MGSLRELLRAKAKVSALMLVDYGQPRDPSGIGRICREEHREQIRDVAAQHGAGVSEHAVDTLSVNPFVELLDMGLQRAAELGSGLALDITCLSRLHAVAAASHFARHGGERCKSAVVVYTLPENYGGLAEDRRDFAGFLDCAVVPLSPDADLGDEARARGVVLPGYEHLRLLAGLTQVEPPGGCIVEAITPLRPDFHVATLQRNELTLSRLRASQTWSTFECRFTDSLQVTNTLFEQVTLAKHAEAPIFMYPFGPRSLVFVVGYVLAKEYPRRSWVVYPVPSFHDARSTEGVGDSYWAPFV
jgi:hypothetical protein